MSKVTVVVNKTTGKVVSPSANPEYGYVRVEQKTYSYDMNGFEREKVVSALIKNKMEILEGRFYAGQELDGKIITLESFEPTNPNNLEQDLKVAGETGIVCKADGRNIYSKRIFTTDMSMSDARIAHTNGAEIKAKQAELKAQSAL